MICAYFATVTHCKIYVKVTHFSGVIIVCRTIRIELTLISDLQVGCEILTNEYANSKSTIIGNSWEKAVKHGWIRFSNSFSSGPQECLQNVFFSIKMAYLMHTQRDRWKG